MAENVNLKGSNALSLSVVTSSKGNLNKSFSVVDGELSKESHALLVSGVAVKGEVNSFDELESLLSNLAPNQAITSGLWEQDNCFVGTEKAIESAGLTVGVDGFTRSQKHMALPKQGKYLVLLDNDPHPKGRTFATAKDYADHIRTLLGIPDLGVLVRPSSSAGVHVAGGSVSSTPVAWHGFIMVDSGVMLHELRDYFEQLSWDNKDGYIALAKNGAKLKRCTFDLAVFTHERLMFESAPLLGDGVHRTPPPPFVEEGRSFSLSDFHEVDSKSFKVSQALAMLKAEDESKQVYADYIDEVGARYVAGGMESVTLDILDSFKPNHNKPRYELHPDTMVELDNGETLHVWQLDAAYDGTTLADPIEGVSYGRGKSQFYWNNGKPVINSMAHGGILYLVRPKVTPWYESYVMNSSGGFINIEKPKSKLNRDAFNTKYARQPELIGDDGKRKEATEYIKLYSPKGIEMVDGEVYSPTAGVIVQDEKYSLLNLYRPKTHLFVDDYSEAETFILEHLKHLLDDPKEQALLLDWMAWQVQNTGVLVRFVPLLIGCQGDGKTTIFNIVKAAIGTRNTEVVTNKAIKSEFNEWANNGAVACFEEIKMEGKDAHMAYNHLKEYITNDDIQVNRKGTSALMVRNVTNYLACSNHTDAIPVTADDRRWWVLNTKWVDHAAFPVAKFTDYFDKLQTFIKSEKGAAQIHAFLMAHPISEAFKKSSTAPKSKAKARMREDTLSEGALALRERLEYYYGTGEKPNPNIFTTHEKYGDAQLINMTMLNKMDGDTSLNVTWDYGSLPSGKGVALAMKELGWIPSHDGKQVKIHGMPCRLYMMKNIE